MTELPERPERPVQREQPERVDELAAALRELAGADVVAFGGVGLAGQVLPPTEAYRTVAAQPPERADEIRGRLGWLLANGSAAGRAYAVTLLDRLDPAAARTAWRGLLDDPAELTTFSGCLMDQTTLGEYAAARLDQD
ncbi:hypothetical protein [Plantactinospora endophytica]|uniref:Uncharacterized protein n=1 Tax=Plantactinospora endophytica TaxID=673535 RepID=A0ABQ4E2H4_9ACTN|nr:hypothetical protein [Plantactinospora endophytica]GIG88915.1 hypothetical protein Pen02_38510 [Plantactinospora endophytica]